jgi:hypothetical protein
MEDGEWRGKEEEINTFRVDRLIMVTRSVPRVTVPASCHYITMVVTTTN